MGLCVHCLFSIFIVSHSFQMHSMQRTFLRGNMTLVSDNIITVPYFPQDFFPAAVLKCLSFFIVSFCGSRRYLPCTYTDIRALNTYLFRVVYVELHLIKCFKTHPDSVWPVVDLDSRLLSLFLSSLFLTCTTCLHV